MYCNCYNNSSTLENAFEILKSHLDKFDVYESENFIKALYCESNVSFIFLFHKYA